MTHKTYRGLLKILPTNGIFVFGSNPEGRHGKGAAYFAWKYFGAKYGQGYGLQGQSYGIVTKDLRIRKHPSVPKKEIVRQIVELYHFAADHPELEFYIAYSGTGANLNYYTNEQMAMMFNRTDIPPNMVFEEKFYELIKELRS